MSIYLMIVITGRYPLISTENILPFSYLIGITISFMYLWGTYSWFVPAFTWAFKRRIFLANISIFCCWTIINFMVKENIPPLLDSRIIVVSMTMFAGFSYFSRNLLFERLKRQIDNNLFLVVARFDSCMHFLEDVEKLGFGKNFYYVCDSDTSYRFEELKNYVGEPGDLPRILKQRRWAGVIVSLGTEDLRFHSQTLMEQKFQGLSLYTISDYYELNWLRVPLYALDRAWFAFSSGFVICHNNFWLRFKRLIDISCSILIGVVAAPILLLVGILICIETPGGAIYTQERMGMNGKVFTMYKLRSMFVGAEVQEGGYWTSVGDKRITRIGRLIRKFRLDEIPQLWNILKGDMSLIGPRPEALDLVKIYEKQIPFYNTRHLVKPGVTGWAQVMYGYGNSVNHSVDKLEYDLYYIKNFSLILDLNIIIKTIRVVFGRKGL